MTISPTPATILFLDDEAQHLKLYQWVIERGPFRVTPVLVGDQQWKLPEAVPDVVVLDYRLKGPFTAVQVAESIKLKFPEAPILILSELEWVPDDIYPYASAFVGKGEPEKLMQTLMELVRNPVSSNSDGAKIIR